MANKELLPDTKPGDILTAAHQTKVTRAINSNTTAIAAPRQIDTSEELTGSPPGSGLTDLNFIETSRTESTVVHTDSNGDTLDIEIIDVITFENSSGNVLTLTLTN